MRHVNITLSGSMVRIVPTVRYAATGSTWPSCWV